MAQAARNYTESEMARMQQEALERVREMQNRAKKASAENGEAASTQPRNRQNRNWNTNPNFQRRQRRAQQEAPPPPPPPPSPPPSSPEKENCQEEPKNTTLLQDILGAVGLDNDRTLLLGLLLILVNEKADTTLILALIYLLI